MLIYLDLNVLLMKKVDFHDFYCFNKNNIIVLGIVMGSCLLIVNIKFRLKKKRKYLPKDHLYM